MAKKTYAEIREEMKSKGADMSSSEYAKLLNRITGSQDYDAGLGGGFGKAIKGGSYALDQTLSPFSEATGNIGGFLFGEPGEHAFKMIPRMTLEMAPFYKGGKVAVAGGSALMAANTYEKTDSKGAAAIAGAAGLAMPFAGRAGAAAFTSRPAQRLISEGSKVLVADGLKREILTGAAGQAALKFSGQNALNLGVGLNAGQRFAQAAGTQAGMFGINTASAATQGAYMGGLPGFAATFEPENLAAMALSQLPFMAHSGIKALWNSPEANQVAAYAKTKLKYNSEIYNQVRQDPIHDYILSSYQASVKDAATVVPETTNFTTSFGTAQPKTPEAPDPNFPKTGTMTINKEKWNVYGTPEQIGEGTFTAGSTAWLQQKTGTQNIVFPTRQAALGFIKANKIELDYYDVRDVPGSKHVTVKLRHKPLPQPGQDQVVYTPEMWNPKPKFDPQMELGLQKAADEVRATTAQVTPPLPENAPPTAPAQPKIAEEKFADSTIPEDSGLDSNIESTSAPVQEAPKTNIDVIREAPLETKLQLIDHDNPEVSIPVAITLSESGPRILANEVKARADLPLSDRVEEAVQVVKQKAKEVVATKETTKGVAEANRLRAVKNSEEKADWWKETSKTLPPEVLAVYNEFASKNTEGVKSERYQSDLYSAVYRWYHGTTKAAKEAGGTPQMEGAKGLRNVLAAIKETAKLPQRVKTIPVTGVDSQGRPVLKPEGAGRTTRLSFDTKEDAQNMVDKFKALDENSNWTIRASGKKFTIDNELLEKPALSVDENTLDETLGKIEEQVDQTPFFEERELATSDLARKVQAARESLGQKSTNEYVLNLHKTEEGQLELENLGRLESEDSVFPLGEREATAAELGARRLEFALNAFQDGQKMQDFFNKLKARTDLFSNDRDTHDFLLAAAPHIATWSKAKLKLMGTRRMGNETTTVNLEGERVLLPELLKQVGLAEPEFASVASRLVSLHDNQQLAWAQLTNPEQAGAVGVFSASRLGEKMVWLATQGSKEATMFTLAHELHGHGLWDLYQQGKLDSQTSERMRVFSEYVKTNTLENPEANNLILSELLAQLPKQYRDNPELQALVRKHEGDVEEVISNVHALLALNTVVSSKGKMAELMQYLPAPISNLIAAIGKYGRKFMTSIGGILLNREKQGSLDSTGRKQLETYIDTMKSILHVNESNAKAVEQAMRLQVASVPERFGLTITSPEGLDGMLSRGLPEATRDVAKFMSLDKLASNMAKPYKKASTFWDHYLQLGTLLGQKFSSMRYVTSRAVESQKAYNKIEFEMLRLYNMKKVGASWVADPKDPITLVAGNERLADVRDNVIRAINKGKYPSHMDAINANDKTVMAELGKLTPAEQILIRENLVKFEAVQTQFSEVIRNQRYEKLGHQVATQLMYRDGTKSLSQAKAEAGQYISDVRSGKFTTTGYSDVDTLIQFGSKNFEDFHTMATTQRGFVTETRFGKFKAKVEFVSDKRPAFIDAHTESEFNMLRQQYEQDTSNPMKAWIDKTKYTDTEFRMNDQVEFLISMDAQHSNELAAALIREGLPQNRVQELVDTYSFSKELRNEMALRELADSSGKIAKFEKRRFVAGREHLDMLQQQIIFMQTVARGLTKSNYKADFDAGMASPEMRVHPERELAKQMWENFSKRDFASTKKINRVQYGMFMSFHFLNMLQDRFQPLLGALPANLVNEGQTIIGSYKGVSKAMLQVMTKKGLTPNEKLILEEIDKTNSGLGMYSDETNNDVFGLIQARRIQKGLDPGHIWDSTKKAVLAPFLWGKSLHKHQTDYSNKVATLATYRHYIAKGLTHQQALDSANQLVPIAMFNAGKAGRPIGIRKGEGVLGQNTAAIMTGLQTYALGTIGTFKNFIDLSVGAAPGMTQSQKVSARKALATHFVSTIAQTGLYGLPGVAVALVALEKLAGIKAREAVAGFFKDDDLDEGEEDVVQQVALHGLMNSVTGYDIASKSSVTGILGFNAYSGYSLDQLAGPTGQLVRNMVNAVEAAGNQQWTSAGKEFLPNQLKRLVTQAQNDYEFRDKDQKLIDYSSPSEQGVFAALGIKPDRVARQQELISMQYASNEIDKEDNFAWVVDQAKLLEMGDVATVQQNIYKRVQEDDNLNPEALSQIITKQMIDMQTPQDPREMQGASGDLTQAMGAPTYQGPSALEQFQMQQQGLNRLGFNPMPSLRSIDQKRRVSELQQENPSMSRKEIMELLQKQGKLSLPQLRNQSWLNDRSGYSSP